METKGTYQAGEHGRFKRTFLTQTEVIATFHSDISSDAFLDSVVDFLNKVFGLKVGEDIDKKSNHFELTSIEEQKRFVFDVDKARIIIGQSSYVSFADTALPMIEKLQKYVADVAKTNEIDSLKIIKVNRWPFDTKDAISNYANILKYTFKDEIASDMLHYAANGTYKEPFKISKKGRSESEDGAILDSELSVDVESKEKVVLGLCLNATASNVKMDNFIVKTIELNNLAYKGFIETISNDIIALMSREE